MTKKLIAREDAEQLRYHAASLTYNDTTAEGEAKHRLHEIAMRIETGYYASDALQVAEFDKHRIEVLQARVADVEAAAMYQQAYTEPDDVMFASIENAARASFHRHKYSVRGQQLTRAEIVKVRANIARLEKLLAETLHAEKDFRARGLMK